MNNSATSCMSRLLKVDQSVLLVVDIQEKLLPALEDPEKLLAKTAILIQAFAQLKLPIVVSEQVPHKLGATAPQLAKLLPTESAIFGKSAFGCGQDPDILAFIGSLNRQQVILCGIETHVCVNQTAHQLLEEGYQVHLVTDAIQSRNKKDHKMALAKMQQSGVIPASVESVLFELMVTCEHPAFKLVQALIK